MRSALIASLLVPLIALLLLAPRPARAGDEPAAATPPERTTPAVPPASPGPAVVEPESSLDWIAVPLATYSADDGLGLGAAGNFQWLGGGVEPYRHQLTAQLLFTLKGLQSHWIHYDAPHVFGSSLRLWARLEFTEERHSPYFGLGNHTAPEAPAVANDPPVSFHKTSPMLRTGVSFPFSRRLFGFAFLTAQQVNVSADAGSRLDRDRPLGFAGGFAPNLQLGLYHDARDNEVNPSKGTYVEASVRGQGPAASFPFVGFNAYGRLFVPLLGERLVFASRLIVDYVSAGAPFWELSNLGTLDSFEGIGGQYSARGLEKDRYIGRLKALGSLELRTHVVDVPAPGGPISLGLLGFVDYGRVWMLQGQDGPFFTLHPGYGFGLRAWRRAFVVRADLGFSPDRGVAPYILFGHLF